MDAPPLSQPEDFKGPRQRPEGSARRRRARQTDGFGLNAGRVDTPMTIAHQHQDIEVNYVESGRASYRIAGNPVELASGEMLVFWAIISHQLQALPDAGRIVYLHLPLNAFFHWTIASDLVHRVSSGEVLRVRNPRYADLDRANFSIWADDLDSTVATVKPTRRQQALQEIELRFRRITPADWNGQSAASHGPVPEVVVEMAKCIAAECLDADFCVGTAAEAVGLNERYAMSLFKKHLGMTIHEFILRHRVTHAQHLLMTTSRTVLAVGMDSGFSSQSGFYAAFKRFCGMAPARFRDQQV